MVTSTQTIMNTVRILRVVTVSCLAVCLHTSTVNATHISSLNETTSHPSTNRQLFFVKGILEFLGKLDESDIKDTVLMNVSDNIKRYLHVKGIPGESIEANLTKLLETLGELRNKVLKNPFNYRKYSDLDPSNSSLDKYADFVVHCLSILHSELWFLHFQTAEECSQYGGYSWNKQQFGNKISPLHKWLTDTIQTGVPFTLKGFDPDDLNVNNIGKHVAGNTGISLRGGPLNHAQYGLFLLSGTWHDSNLASAVLFLQEFCRELQGNRNFTSSTVARKYVPLKDLCKSLYSKITSFINVMVPLYRGATSNPYNANLKADAIGLYVDWLSMNLDDMIKSLKQMSSESKYWTNDMFYNGKSAGPFKYGFVFKDTNWEEPIKSKLGNEITTVIEGSNALAQLYDELKKLVPRPHKDL